MNPLDRPSLREHRFRWLLAWVAAEGGSLSAANRAHYALWTGVFATLAVLLLLAACLILIHYSRSKSKARTGQKRIEGAVKGLGYDRLTPAEEKNKIGEMDISIAEGLAKLRERGVNVYEAPWYLVVGAPDAGKTAACLSLTKRLGNPKGMNKAFVDDNVPGTTNLNWWFYRQAVFLDTAGRMAFQVSAEWETLLEQLKEIRPDRPINGAILVIGEDELILDQNDMQERAEALAEQLNKTKLNLGIRFPVYVLVTKVDRIPGFSDFFRDLNDQKERDQIIGWSNADLDGASPLNSPSVQGDGSELPPNPDDETEYATKTLNETLNGLARWRLALIGNVGTESINQRCAELEKAHLFSSELRKRLKNLDLYFRNILGQQPIKNVDENNTPAENEKEGVPVEQHSVKVIDYEKHKKSRPLFLRGVYLASSTQDGTPEPADEDEESVNHAVKTQGFERRFYFLKDLVLKKILLEQKLVTADDSVDVARKKQWLYIAFASIGALSLVVFFAWFLSHAIRSGVGHESKLWQLAASVSDTNPAVILDMIRTGRPIDINEPKSSLIGLHTNLMHRTMDSSVPFIFLPMKLMPFGNMDDLRRQRQRELFERQIVKSVLIQTRAKLISTEIHELLDAGAEIRQLKALLLSLLRLEAEIDGSLKSPDNGRALFTTCLAYLQVPDKQTVTNLLSLFDHTYDSKYSSHLVWPKREFTGGGSTLDDNLAIKSGLDHFIRRVEEANTQTKRNFDLVNQAKEQLETFSQAEETLYQGGADGWGKLLSAAGELNRLKVDNRDLPSLLTNGLFIPTTGAYPKLQDAAEQSSRTNYDQFASQLSVLKKEKGQKLFQDVCDNLSSVQIESKTALLSIKPVSGDELDYGCLAMTKTGSNCVYECRWRILSELQEQKPLFAVGGKFTNYLNWRTNLDAANNETPDNEYSKKKFEKMTNFVFAKWAYGVTQRWTNEYAARVESALAGISNLPAHLYQTPERNWQAFEANLALLERLHDDLDVFGNNPRFFTGGQSSDMKTWEKRLREECPEKVKSCLEAVIFGLKGKPFPFGPSEDAISKDGIMQVVDLCRLVQLDKTSNVVTRQWPSAATNVGNLATQLSKIHAIVDCLSDANHQIRKCFVVLDPDVGNPDSLVHPFDSVRVDIDQKDGEWMYWRSGVVTNAIRLSLTDPLVITAGTSGGHKENKKEIFSFPGCGLLELVKAGKLQPQENNWRVTIRTNDKKTLSLILDFGGPIPLDRWQEQVVLERRDGK